MDRAAWKIEKRIRITTNCKSRILISNRPDICILLKKFSTREIWLIIIDRKWTETFTIARIRYKLWKALKIQMINFLTKFRQASLMFKIRDFRMKMMKIQRCPLAQKYLLNIRIYIMDKKATNMIFKKLTRISRLISKKYIMMNLYSPRWTDRKKGWLRVRGVKFIDITQGTR